MYLLDSQDFSNLYKNGDFSIDFPESFIIAVEVHPTKTKNTKYIYCASLPNQGTNSLDYWLFCLTYQ